MPHVQVTIAGRSYRMACGEGEEAHLTALAAMFDGKITDMRGAFGEIGDMRLHVMAALTLADEIGELRARVSFLEEETASARARLDAETGRAGDTERDLAAALAATAERIERLAEAAGQAVAAHTRLA